MLVAQGKLDAALEALRADLAIAERLAAADAGNTRWQRDLAVSYNKVGDVLKAQGKLDEALKAYRDGLAVVARLVAADPGNTEWQRDLSISHNRIGDLLAGAGRREEAIADYRKGLEICEKLVAIDPGNTLWQTDLVIAWSALRSTATSRDARLIRALDIVRRLDGEGKLTTPQRAWIELIEQALAKLPT